MRLLHIHTWRCFWQRNGRYGVEMQFHHAPMLTVWLSTKQMNRLLETLSEHAYSTAHHAAYAVLDGERFVWCGTDPHGMAEHFGVTEALPEIDPHYAELRDPQPVEHDELRRHATQD